MKKTFVLGSLFLLLPACTSLVEGSARASRDVQEQGYKTADKLRELFTYHPKSTALKPVPPSYCYRVLQDILCYAEPLADAEDRLVAYQGTVAVAPAAPPRPVILPKAVLPEKTVGSNAPPPSEPASTVPALQPIFIEPPPEVKSSAVENP